MANEVCSGLGLNGKELSGKLVAIVEEHGSNASFILGSIMWNTSKSNSSLCLVALHNLSPHYQSVAKRLGFNLKAAIDDKTAVVLEPFFSNIGTSSDFSQTDMHDQDNLKRLFQDVYESLISLPGKKCLMIDDLSALMCLGASVADVVSFIQNCRALQDSDKDLALVVCTPYSDENADQKLLSNFIAHVADLAVNLAALKTGFSSNVTGSLEIDDRLSNGNISGFNKRHFHFKLTDRTVKLFAPGAIGIPI